MNGINAFCFVSEEDDGEPDAKQEREDAVKFPVDEHLFQSGEDGIGILCWHGLFSCFGCKCPAGEAKKIIEHYAEKCKATKDIKDLIAFCKWNRCCCLHFFMLLANG